MPRSIRSLNFTVSEIDRYYYLFHGEYISPSLCCEIKVFQPLKLSLCYACVLKKYVYTWNSNTIRMFCIYIYGFGRKEEEMLKSILTILVNFQFIVYGIKSLNIFNILESWIRLVPKSNNNRRQSLYGKLNG